MDTDHDTVPAILLPVFYLFSYGCAAVCSAYAVIVYFASKIVIREKNFLKADRFVFFAVGTLTFFSTLLFSFGIIPMPGCNTLYGL